MLSRARSFLRRSPAARVILTLALLGVIGYSVFRVGRHYWAGSHLQAARAALDLGQVGEARAHLLLCLQVRADDPEVQLLLGRVARRAGDYKAAEEHLLRAKRLGGVPEEIQLEKLLQDVQRGEAGSMENQLLVYVDKAHPDTLDILDALARGYLVTFRLGQARDTIDRLLERQPNNAAAWVIRGKAVYHMAGNGGEPANNYGRAVELAPNDKDARLLLAECLVENSRPADALPHFNLLLKQTPDDQEVLVGHAHCLLDLGQSDEARHALDRALKLFPENTTALTLRGKLHLRQLEPSAAERVLRKAVELDGGDRDAVYNLSLCLQQQESKEKKVEADKWFQQFKLIESEQARMSGITKQIMASPRDPSLRFDAGELLLRIGNEKEGLRWLYSALQQDPQHQPTHRVLRDYYRSKGKMDRAEVHERSLTQK